jgi:hypothetical protein
MVLQFGDLAGDKQLITINAIMLRNVTQGIRLEWILWNDPENGKWARDLEHETLG